METKCKKDEVITEDDEEAGRGLGQPQSPPVCSSLSLVEAVLRGHKKNQKVQNTQKCLTSFISLVEMFLEDHGLSRKHVSANMFQAQAQRKGR